MTPQDLRSNLVKIKENQDRLFSCKRHNFGDCPTPYHFGQTFVCLNCQGSMKAVDAFRYIQGYEAAGRNPNDILSGYRADWKPQPAEQGYRIFKDGDQWCAVGHRFIDIQQSPAGFADTPAEALNQLMKEFGKAWAAKNGEWVKRHSAEQAAPKAEPTDRFKNGFAAGRAAATKELAEALATQPDSALPLVADTPKYNRAREMADEVMAELDAADHGWNEDDIARIQGTLLPRVYDCLNLLFDEAWKTFEAQGFRYGRDALEQVRFGWNIAHGYRVARKPA